MNPKDSLPARLVADFGARSPLFAQTLRALLGAAETHRSELPPAPAPEGKWAAALLARLEWPARSVRPARLVVVLRTYYAILCKMLALLIADALRGGGRNDFASWAVAPSGAFGMEVVGLESGGAAAELGVRERDTQDPYGWYAFGALGELEPALRKIVQRLSCYAGDVAAGAGEGPIDLLRELYHDLIPPEVRHAEGEYFTPDWLAERLVLLTLGTALGDATKRVLDPTCGSGTFPASLIRHVRRRAAHEGRGSTETLGLILQNVQGMDVSPLAILAARANYLFALGVLLREAQGEIVLPLRLCDCLAPAESAFPFDYVIGNPPWVNWESLPAAERERTRPQWKRAGLFAGTGMGNILGRGKKELALLVTCVVLEHRLREGGRLGFVLPESAFKSAGAAQGFRAFHLPAQETHFAPERVEDVSPLRPFEDEGAANRPVLAVFVKGERVSYPVPWFRWTSPPPAHPVEWQAEPVDATDPGSPWVAAAPSAMEAMRRVRGPCAFTAREGVNTGGANAVYWVRVGEATKAGLWRVSNVTENARTKVPRVRAKLEADCIFPLLRGRDVARWKAAPSIHIVLAQNPATRTGVPVEEMRARCPRTFRYLKQFEKVLRARKSQAVRSLMARGAFYSMFGVSVLTQAPHKVVWRELAYDLDAAVVGAAIACGRERPILPDHTCVFVACNEATEAHYLCALVNSSPARTVVRRMIGLHPDPHVLGRLRIPAFHAGNALHAELAALSQAAHRADDEGRAAIEEKIDRCAAQLWELTADQLATLREGCGRES